MPRSIGALSAFALIVLGAISLPTNALALTKYQINKGYSDCVAWCGEHNKTQASLNKCDVQCEHYWYHVVKQPQALRKD